MIEIRKESGDDRDYFKGLISRPKSGAKGDMAFTLPAWNIDPLVQKQLEAKAYFESETESPLVRYDEFTARIEVPTDSEVLALFEHAIAWAFIVR